MSISVTLRQITDILDVGYRVISQIISANPSGMQTLFVLQPGAALGSEIYIRVANLDDLNAYVVNPLVRFQDEAGSPFGSAAPGDKLIFNPSNVPEWICTPYFTNAKFTVVGTDPGYLLIDGAKPFPYSKNKLVWELKNSTETIVRATGTAGYTTRLDLSANPFLRPQLTSILGSVESGSSRAGAIKSGIRSTVNAAKKHGPDFTGEEVTVFE